MTDKTNKAEVNMMNMLAKDCKLLFLLKLHVVIQQVTLLATWPLWQTDNIAGKIK